MDPQPDTAGAAAAADCETSECGEFVCASQIAPLRAPLCPLCGQPNACTPALEGRFDRPCWCTEVSFSARVLDQVPEPQRGLACICRRCAEQHR